MDWNNHYATLFRDYLLAAPDDERWSFRGLPVACGTDTEELAQSRIDVTCEKQESNHSRIFAGKISITLCAPIEVDGDQAETLASQAGMVEAYLTNDALWAAFIQGLDVERRQGWQIMHKRIEPGVEEERDDQEHWLKLTCVVQLRAVAKR